MFLDIWLFWCQEMCDESYFGFFLNLLQVFWWFHQWFLLLVLRF